MILHIDCLSNTKYQLSIACDHRTILNTFQSIVSINLYSWLYNRFTSKREDWIELLGTNEDGEPTYPQRGMPESRYNPDNQDLARKTSLLEEILTSTRDALSNFVISLPAYEQLYIIQESILPLLKNLDAINAYCDRNPIGNADDQEREDDENTIVNGGNEAAGENPNDQKPIFSIKEMIILFPHLVSLQGTR